MTPKEKEQEYQVAKERARKALIKAMVEWLTFTEREQSDIRIVIKEKIDGEKA
jgi:hypothetical protein